MAARIEKNAQEFVGFLTRAVSPFHAVDECSKILEKAGFQRLKEVEHWDLRRGGKYFFTRNQSAIMAFAVGEKYEVGNGFNIVGAHTDSPNLKLKPVSNISKGGFLEVGVETYGGGLWHTWFDRDLTVAGRCLVEDSQGNFVHKLVNVKKPIMRVPTLAIHLDRNVNAEGFKFNAETQLLPVLSTAVKGQLGNAPKSEDGKPAHHAKFMELIASELNCKPEQIKDFEISVLDAQPPAIGGIMNEFVFSGRLDNLAMCWCGLQGLINGVGDLSNETNVRALCLYDHEEVGSMSNVGADTTLLKDTMRRVALGISGSEPLSDTLDRAVNKSLLVSADMAHALHPNYMEKHENNHQPAFHKGVTIKHNAKQRYATNSVTAVALRELATKHCIPLQEFVVRNDSPCGTTIGPIIASNTGIKTIDVGTPQLSMHSIREMCGTDDVTHAIDLFKVFFDEYSEVDAKFIVD